ncbi:dual oxidase maturation factor 1-like [Glandiceps talaboti]
MAPIYSAFRDYGLPTMYPEHKTAVTVDIVIAGLIYAISIIAISIIIIIPGVQTRERIFFTIRAIVGLIIGAAIILANFGQEWETANIVTGTQYKAFIGSEIEASIGVKIGLRSVNITLKGEPVNQLGERIDYNERFNWAWDQGRQGFGPFAGVLNQEFREAQWKGLPYPILWIAEYFTIDGENIRWGRSYREAGFFTHICLWVAFPLWLLTLILFSIIIRYASYFSLLTGGVLLLSNLIYGTLRTGPDLEIPFQHAVLRFHFGWSFWIILVTGLLCLCLGIIIWLLDYYFPVQTATFFGHDIIENFEECFIETNKAVVGGPSIPPSRDYLDDDSDDGETYANIHLDVIEENKRSKPRFPPPLPTLPPPGPDFEDDDDIYINREIEYAPAMRPKAGHRYVRKPRPPALPPKLGPSSSSAAAPRRAQRGVRLEVTIEEDEDDDYMIYGNIPRRKTP